MFCALGILRAHRRWSDTPTVISSGYAINIAISLSIKLIPGAFFHEICLLLFDKQPAIALIFYPSFLIFSFAWSRDNGEESEEATYFLFVTRYAMQNALRKIVIELKCKLNEVVRENAQRKRRV